MTIKKNISCSIYCHGKIFIRYYYMRKDYRTMCIE